MSSTSAQKPNLPETQTLGQNHNVSSETIRDSCCHSQHRSPSCKSHHCHQNRPPIQQQPSSIVTQQQQQPIYSPNQPIPTMIAQPISPYRIPDGPLSTFPDINFRAFLKNATGFYVRQQIDMLELFTDLDGQKRYEVLDQFGNRIFWVLERSPCCDRCCFTHNRAFEMMVKDVRGANVLRFERSLNCSLCCGAFFPDEMSIMTPEGQSLGSVKEEFSCLPRLKIKDSSGRARLRIEGPLCTTSCCCNSVIFNMLTMEGVQVGIISKHWAGFETEFYTKANNFSITFPSDLDSSIKATCLGALFLIVSSHSFSFSNHF